MKKNGIMNGKISVISVISCIMTEKHPPFPPKWQNGSTGMYGMHDGDYTVSVGISGADIFAAWETEVRNGTVRLIQI